MSGRSLEKVKAHALRVLEPLRSEYSAKMLESAVDHILLHDPGQGRCAVPVAGLSKDLRDCVGVCAVVLQSEMNRVRGIDNPVEFVRWSE